MSELHWLGALDLARAIADKRLSPVEIVRTHLDRIARLDSKLKSYLAVFAESALDQARVAEKAVLDGQPLGALHGVPLGIKDLYAVKGTPTTAGSPILKDVAPQDCTVVARLRSAGAIILGKLNLHEFAYGPEGINPNFGSPWNPWDAEVHRIAGGSSSGSGVAVAAGLTPVGMGSDTGGSIRIPAACCGTVGLKPTYGRVSRTGIVGLGWSLDHAGPLTRSVADAALVLNVIAGHDPTDPTTTTRPVPDYVASLTGPVRGLRVGILKQYLDQSAAEVRAALDAVILVLKELGCTTEPVELRTLPYSLGIHWAILCPEAAAYHEPLIRRHAANYAPDVRRRILAGHFLSGIDYLKGQRARCLVRDEINTVLQRFDCLLTPTLPVPAPKIGADELHIDDRPASTRAALTEFNRLFNLSGHPALAVPCGFTHAGLPLSAQFVGRAFDESTVLRLGHAYEQATAWHQRRPPLA